jgi:tRNA threonylcarbamoyl adenosine modification protein (Sua5/YciO/YrdC/YwlC family)
MKNQTPTKIVAKTLYIEVADATEAWKTMDIVEPLNRGGVGVIPTETGYVLATRLDSKAGVERLLRIKGMHECKKPLSLLCSNLATIDQYCVLYSLPKQTFKILKKNLPGPYTFILSAKKTLPKGIVFDSKGSKHSWKRDTLGIRMPSDPILRYFQDELYQGEPLLVSSLPHDNDDDEEEESNSFQHIITLQPDAPWYDNVDFVVDAGPRPRDGSTIIDLTSTNGEPELIREGLGTLTLTI